jgi:hypothetical protein
MCLKNVQKKSGNTLLFQILFLLFSLFAFVATVHADFNDCAVDWNLFKNAPGFIADYTYKGQAIKDHESTGSGDPSHGQANVPPSDTDLASDATSSVNPGGETTPFFGYYNGGTPYDPLNPSTMNDDVIFFRMRLAGDPSASAQEDFKCYHWNVLFDIDADGYKEYWIDLDGCLDDKKTDSTTIDRLQVLYDNSNNQVLNPDGAGVRRDIFRAYNTDIAEPSCPVGSPGYSHTRVVATGDGQYWLEEQIPMTAFKDSNGNQLLYPNSPVAFVYSTGASANDPLQKDWMMDLNWLSNADPITFGDIVKPDGTPIIEFTDSVMNFVNFYTVGNRVYVYVKDPSANQNHSAVETMTVTITDPITGDDERITLTETGPSTGIFSDINAPDLLDKPLTTTTASIDDDGQFTTASGHKIYVSYTNSSHITSTDQADIVAPCEPYIQFTRANGLPSDSFVLTNNSATSDKLYVTVTHPEANTNPATQQTVTVSLSGNDAYTMTLIETGNNTGVFRNTTGLLTQVETLPVSLTDSLWEDVDSGTVIATYDYPVYGSCPANQKTTTASIFVTLNGGRVYFTDATGLQDVELYGPDQDVYIKVVDRNNCGTTPGRTINVTVTNSSNGDSDQVTLVETATGSCTYRNTTDSLKTNTLEGEFYINDNSLETLDGATLTVTYIDSNDGDSDPSNNNKTDTATYNAPSIVINEVLFYPQMIEGANCVMEYIQLYNATPSAVDVTGYRITDGDDFEYIIPQYDGSSLMLQPREKIYIALYEVVPADRYDSVKETYYLFTEAAKPYCSVTTGTSCTTDANCPAGTCSVSAGTCHSDLDCNPGYCSATTSQSCHYNSECPDEETCVVTDTCEGGEICITFPSIELNDPRDTNPSDQILLYDNEDMLIDYVGWSSTINPDTDFLGDDSPAVSKQIWQDDAFVNVNGIPGQTLPIAPGEALMRKTAGYDTNTSNDWQYSTADESCNLIITRAVISSFNGHIENGKVVIEWKTSSEIGTVGFFLYRKDETTGDYVQVTRKLVPGVLTSRRGGEYRLFDESALPGTVYTYLLVEVESSGKRNTYGPYTVNTDEQKTVLADPVFIKAGYSRKAFALSPSKEMSLTAAALQKQSLYSQGSSHNINTIGAYAAPTLFMTGAKTKVAISENNLYFIDSATLLSFIGTDIAKMFGSTQLKITNQGQEIPYLIAPDKSGIYFYGQEMNTVYTDKNIYWFEKMPGRQMPVSPGAAPVAASGNETFLDTIHREEDSWAATTLFTNPDADYWMWDYVVADDPVFDTVTFVIEANGVASTVEDATLTVHLHGATNTDHHAVVNINGTTIGESSWFGTKAHTFKVSLNQSLILEGENQVKITGLLDAGAPYSIFYFDSIDLGYHRLYKAVNDKLFLRGDSNPVVTVSGYTSPVVAVFNITSPKAPKLIQTTQSTIADDGTYQVSFKPISPSAEYLAISKNGVSTPVSIIPDTASYLRYEIMGSNYIVITPKELKQGAQSLANYRKTQGLKPLVAELEDIMDEFNYGIYSPNAIKQFLTLASPLCSYQPCYVLLVGHGSEDYKDLLGLGENLLPPIMIGTADGLVPSDNHFTDRNRDHIPDLAIGRLPVLTPQALQALIGKIKGYESTSGIWTKDVLLLADSPEPGGDFPADSEMVASLVPPAFVKKKVYLSQYPLGDARQMVMDGINRGALIVNFIGHAGLDRLAQDGLIVSDDVSTMNNGGKLPVLTAMTCMIGLFSLPGYDTLGEEMLLKENGGAIAVFAPSSMSINSEASVLDRELFSSFFQTKTKRTLGNIILNALKRSKMNGVSGSLLEQYNILGDPALLVK